MGQEAQPSRAPDAQGRGEDVRVVDYPGQTVPMVDLATGEIRQAHIFVAVLAASSYTYAEAQWAEDLPNWIGGHVRALAFFSGVPEIIVRDNSSLQRAVPKPPASPCQPPSKTWSWPREMDPTPPEHPGVGTHRRGEVLPGLPVPGQGAAAHPGRLAGTAVHHRSESVSTFVGIRIMEASEVMTCGAPPSFAYAHRRLL